MRPLRLIEPSVGVPGCTQELYTFIWWFWKPQTSCIGSAAHRARPRPARQFGSFNRFGSVREEKLGRRSKASQMGLHSHHRTRTDHTGPQRATLPLRCHARTRLGPPTTHDRTPPDGSNGARTAHGSEFAHRIESKCIIHIIPHTLFTPTATTSSSRASCCGRSPPHRRPLLPGPFARALNCSSESKAAEVSNKG